MVNPLRKIFNVEQNKEIATNSIFLFVFKIFGIATTYIFTLIITRYYGPSAIGIFSISYTVLMLVGMLSMIGLENGSLKFIALYNSQNDKEQISSIYWRSWKIIATISFLTSILFYILSPIVAKYILHKTDIEVSLKIISVAIFPMALQSINQESLRAINKVGYYSFFLTQSSFLFGTAIIGIILITKNNIKTNDPVIAITLGIIASCIWSQVVWLKHSGAHHYFRKKIKHITSTKQLLSLSWTLLLSNLMNFIMQWSDMLILGAFCSVETVGIYATSVKLANFVTIPHMVLTSISAPTIVGYYIGKQKNNLINFIKKITNSMSISTLLFAGFLFLFREEALKLFGPQFVSGITVLQILIIAKIIQAIIGPAGIILQMTGKEILFRNIMVITATTNIILNVTLVSQFKQNGAAISTLLSVLLLSILSKVNSRLHIQKFCQNPH